MENETKVVETKGNNEEFVIEKTVKFFKWEIPVGHRKSDEKPEDGSEENGEKKGIKKTLQKVAKIGLPIAAVGGAVIGAIALLGGGSDVPEEDCGLLGDDSDGCIEVDAVEVELADVD